MKHDIFEFDPTRMTRGQIFWRVVFLATCIAILLADLLIWRP